MDGAVVIDTPEGIEMFRLLALRGALKLEMRGLRRRGQSAASIVKELLGLGKCRNQEALAKLEERIAEKFEERRRS